jgi:uncharacterized repeat protein (TIGR03943 family)
LNRQAQAVVLVLVGGAVLRASLTDLHLRYVKAGLQPFLIIAGVLLIAAAAATLWYEFRPSRAAEGAHGHDTDGAADDTANDGHGHHDEPRVAWLLVLPVFALLLVAPQALGSYAAQRSGTAVQQVSDFPPLPAGDPVRVGVLDYATRAVFDDGRSLQDRNVKLSGFIMAGVTPNEPMLARMILSCCAADARPVKVGLTGRVPDGLKPDAWVEVIGRYTNKSTKDTVNGGVIPFVDVAEVRQIAAPPEQYES